MEINDLNQIMEFINERLESRWVRTDAKFEQVLAKLAAIETQVLKTNGRVTVLEDSFFENELKAANHFNSCPNNKAIRELQDENLTRKSVKNWIIAGISVSSGAIGLYFLIQKLLTL